MRRFLSVVLLICMVLIVASGCSENDAPQPENNISGPQQDPVAQSGGGEELTTSPSEDTSNDNKSSGNSGTDQQGPVFLPNGVDIDLTVLSKTMLSAQLSNIMSNVNKYLGKKIKISGSYSAFYAEENDKYYSYVITYMDPTFCCSEGMEFSWKGDHKYPDDYPEEGTPIEVIGELKSYEESGNRYSYLEVDEISVLS